MKFWHRIALLFVVLASSWAAAPTTAPSKADPLQALVPFIGEWKIDTTWKDGNPLKARDVYEWGVGKKFIVAKTFVQKPDGTEYQRYETIFGVQDGKLMAWEFVFDGKTDSMEFQVDGKKLVCAKPMDAPAGKPKVILHQSLELVDANSFRWKVAIEQDGKMNELMDGTWVRESSAAK